MGENQKESFTLCGQALLLIKVVVVVTSVVVFVVVVVLVVGLVIPSISLKDKGGVVCGGEDQ